MSKLIKNVYVKGPKGQREWVRPGDEIPEWAEEVLAKNPSVWDTPPAVVEVAPEPEPTPEPAPEPVSEPAPEPVTEPVAEAETESEPEPAKPAATRKRTTRAKAPTKES
ncbi:hypothetical protein PBI_CLUBL_36 [Gordonia phage ClubL]|uniref:Uncharacterized protein n=1 Tax=Gordonia phage ClubL TaxID=1838065 RepID=A0A160DHQ0_9CAUD|nr:hypothetical protein BH768_gp171 [Gordonia phage ClubL]ANA86534.1 hypothetical protein PBI_CLUBL_36 [Gordonia phage ClubL]